MLKTSNKKPQLNNFETNNKQNLYATAMFLLQLTKIGQPQGFKKLTMHLGISDIENFGKYKMHSFSAFLVMENLYEILMDSF